MIRFRFDGQAINENDTPQKVTKRITLVLVKNVNDDIQLASRHKEQKIAIANTQVFKMCGCNHQNARLAVLARIAK